MKGGIIALPGLSDAPVGPANGVLAALSGPGARNPDGPGRGSAGPGNPDLVEAALRKLEEGPP